MDIGEGVGSKEEVVATLCELSRGNGRETPTLINSVSPHKQSRKRGNSRSRIFEEQARTPLLADRTKIRDRPCLSLPM